MIWWYTSIRHERSISTWVRKWLGGSLADRFIQMSGPGFAWFLVWGIVASLFGLRGGFFFVIVALVPWVLWLLDAVVDHYHVKGDLQTFLQRDEVLLATRCEYLGGHPELPHGRFAYLVLEGSLQSPALTLMFPESRGDPHRFLMPVLDLQKTKPDKHEADSLAASALSIFNDSAAKFLGADKTKLVVDYEGGAGRKYRVELTNFFNGTGEIYNWRNFLVCVQAEADTGKKPYGPWRSLRRVATPAPDMLLGATKLEAPHGLSRNGSEERQPSSAFTRR